MDEQFFKKALFGAALGLLAGLAVILVTQVLLPVAFNNFEAKIFDLRYLYKARVLETQRQGAAIEEIIIIDIDNRSLEKLGPYSQWPRSRHASLIDYLQASETACIVFDILFMERDTEPMQDSRLINSTRSAQHVVHALAFSDADADAFLYKMNAPPPGFQADHFTLSLPTTTVMALDSVDRFDGKLMELYNSSAGLGFVNFLPDEDGVIREMPLFLNFAGRAYPSLALAAVMQFHGIGGKDVQVELGREVRLRTRVPQQKMLRIPIDERGRMVINYMGYWKTFRYLSYYDVVEQRVPAEMFKGKIVLVGTSVAGLFDLRPVPFQTQFPGVEVHANIIYNILEQDFITKQPGGFSVAAMLIFAMIAGVITMIWSPWLGIVLTIVISAGYSALSWWFFVTHNAWIPVVQPLLAFGVAFLSVLMYRFLSEKREKLIIKNMFVHYTSEIVVNELLRNPSLLQLGGARKYATAFFSDIKNFTTLSESMTPEELITQLNEYLSAMTDIVLAYGGYLDKYEGDAVVAVFGVPVDQIDHAERACFAALDMQRALAKL
ncbi:MAG: adenylate/guanylate cyclase domain-containing protein, partial [candidate division KSB1 bacterium]|nr:adenylate/guanylate cyclase domain-containing protein [candidate division KSB1 bacterium]